MNSPPRRPTLTLDARWSHTGLGRYLGFLLPALREQTSFQVRLLIAPADRERPEFAGFSTVEVASPMYGWAEQVRLPGAIAGSDLLHSVNYNVPVVCRCPYIVTIHDLTHLIHPAYHTWRKSAYSRLVLTRAAQRAAHIITVSRFSADQIQNRLGVAADEISVIYLEPSAAFRPIPTDAARGQLIEQFGLRDDFFFYVGGLRPHKNIPGLLAGFACLTRDQGWPGQLVLAVGDAKHQPEVELAINQYGLGQRVCLLDRPSDRLLACLYSACTGFVTASQSEGFCLPLIEAMQCGAPVACADATCLPEIAGGAALLFPADQPEAIAAALQQLLTPAVRVRLRARGEKRAAWFGTQRCGEKHLEIYRRLLGVAPEAR